MAKKNEQIPDDAHRLTDEQKEGRTYILDATAWDEGEGEEYGGKSEILLMDIGEVAGPLVYVGHQQMTTELGETTVHLATNGEGETMRLPIQATFLRSIDQADIRRGDRFIVKRFDDTLKKAGKGKGKPMAIYGIKVTERAPVAQAAPAVTQ